MQEATVLLLAIGTIVLCGGALLNEREKRKEERKAKEERFKANHNIMYAHRTKRK